MNKICHVTSIHPRYDGRIFEKECVSLAENFDVTLIVNDRMPEETYQNIQIVATKNPPTRGKLGRLKGLKEIFNTAMEIDAELYHLHDPDLLLIARKLMKKNKKVVFDAHEDYINAIKTNKSFPKPIRSIVSRLYKAYETHVCKNIDGVVFAGYVVDKDGSEVDYFANRCKRSVIVDNYPKKTHSADKIKKKKGFAVCYAGVLAQSRGIDYLIEACYKAKCKLILAGWFSPAEYEENLHQKESYACVDYRGELSLEEVAKLYNEASVGACTLLNIGQYGVAGNFATKVYEYFQAELPVILSDAPYPVRMNEQYHFGITVAPDNVDEIADAIIYIRDNPKVAQKMGKNGYNLYSSIFNWEAEEKKLIQFYYDILGE